MFTMVNGIKVFEKVLAGKNSEMGISFREIGWVEASKARGFSSCLLETAKKDNGGRV